MTYQGAPLEGRESRFRWRTAERGLALPAWIAIGIAVAVLGFGAWWTFAPGRGAPMDGIGMGGPGMGGDGMGDHAPHGCSIHSRSYGAWDRGRLDGLRADLERRGGTTSGACSDCAPYLSRWWDAVRQYALI